MLRSLAHAPPAGPGAGRWWPLRLPPRLPPARSSKSSIVIDQMRPDYFDRYGTEFTGGLREVPPLGRGVHQCIPGPRTDRDGAGALDAAVGAAAGEHRHLRQRSWRHRLRDGAASRIRDRCPSVARVVAAPVPRNWPLRLAPGARLGHARARRVAQGSRRRSCRSAGRAATCSGMPVACSPPAAGMATASHPGSMPGTCAAGRRR